jgi:hypothetical protein
MLLPKLSGTDLYREEPILELIHEELTPPRQEFFDTLPIFAKTTAPEDTYDMVMSHANRFIQALGNITEEVTVSPINTELQAHTIADTFAHEQKLRQNYLFEITGMNIFRHPFVLTALAHHAIRRNIIENAVIQGIRVFSATQKQDLLEIHRPKPIIRETDPRMINGLIDGLY